MATIDIPQRSAKRSSIWKWVAGGAGALLLVVLAALGFMFWRMNYIPADLDLSTTRTSAQGTFRATIRPEGEPIPINSIHSWTLHVETPDGRPVENASHLASKAICRSTATAWPQRPRSARTLAGATTWSRA